MDAYSGLSAHWVGLSSRLVRGSPIVITSPKTSSGSSRRSSSARQSLRLRRGRMMRCAGWPGWVSSATDRPGTEELDVAAGTGQPDPADAGAGGVRHDRDGRVQGQAQPGRQQQGAGGVRGAFHGDSRDGVSSPPGPRQRRAGCASWSGGSRRGRCRRPCRCARMFSSARLRVRFVGRVRDPAVRDPADGGLAGALRGAVRPPGHDRGVREQQRGHEGFAFVGHVARSPRSTMTSEAPASPPTRICASSRSGPSTPASARTMIRQGCSRLASLAASMASSSCPDLVTTTRVRTRPRAITPPCSRRDMIFLEIFEVVVSGRSTIMAFSRFVRRGPAAHRPRPVPNCRERRVRGCSSRPAQYSSNGSRIFQDSSTSWWRGNSGGSPSSTSRMSRS